MSGESLRRATAAELRIAFQSGAATSRAVTDELFAAIEREDGVLGAWLHLRHEEARVEADRADVPAGGIVLDPQVRQGAVDRVAEALIAAGCHVHGQYESPISGAGGNIEFFLWATVHTNE